jgi:D-2-hydroxyacid dehydrogenase (NADP+)
MASSNPTPVQPRTKPENTHLVIAVWHPFDQWRPPAQMSESLRQKWPQMRVNHLYDLKDLQPALADTDIFVGYSIRPHQLPWAPKLKWIHSTAAGVAQLTYAELRDSGIIVTNASGVHSSTIREHVIGLLIALARRFMDSMNFQRQRHWAQQEVWDTFPSPQNLSDGTLLIVGLGTVGREIANRAASMGMKVHGVTRSGKSSNQNVTKVYPAGELHRALAGADYVVIAAPETQDTFHLFGAPELALMKKSAYLVNIARGSLIDESALVDALLAHKIAGAAIDVASEEPLPPESPLWTCPNLLITPHLSAAGIHLWERQTALLIDNLTRWFDGRELLNRVDLSRGY